LVVMTCIFDLVLLNVVAEYHERVSIVNTVVLIIYPLCVIWILLNQKRADMLRFLTKLRG
jgi:hypothetical protein